MFALAPIPLLVHFGHELGDTEHVDLYQRHRDRQDWTWQTEDEGDQAAAGFYEVHKPILDDDDQRPIALLLSVSARVGHDQVTAILGEEALIYEIAANAPGLDFLRSQQRLEIFGYEARRLLADLR